MLNNFLNNVKKFTFEIEKNQTKQKTNWPIVDAFNEESTGIMFKPIKIDFCIIIFTSVRIKDNKNMKILSKRRHSDKDYLLIKIKIICCLT